MKLALPPGLAEKDFNKAIAAFEGIVGKTWVLVTDQDRDTYKDHFAPDATAHVCSAAIAPSSADEVQAILKIANQYKVPLWTISRGKNFGYGSAAPAMSGSVVLDLSRMKKIEFDAENGIVQVEPGVGFYDLYEYIEKHNLPYWVSAPGNSWGSVLGNALERGVGYTNYGDHAARIHGMEVILPDGDVVRTGMGAMENSSTWNLHPYGYGPNWEQLFVQSNFGVVTKIGLWLMPAPESMITLEVQLDKRDDLGWAIDTLSPMRREGLIQQSPSIGNWLRMAAVLTVRSQWYDKPGTLPEDVITAIRKKFNLGWWTVNVRQYGRLEVASAAAKVVKEELQKASPYEVTETVWTKGMPRGGTPASGVPITFPLANSAWHGGRGGHVGFSPILPQSGAAAMAQVERTEARYKEFGMDYHPSFSLGERHITNVNQILFNKDDPEMVAKIDPFFRALVEDSRKEGYGEYRAHIDYMDYVSSTYDFNDNALWRLNEKLKNTLDPNGILSPGKSGIWPEKYKGEKRS